MGTTGGFALSFMLNNRTNSTINTLMNNVIGAAGGKKWSYNILQVSKNIILMFSS